MRTIAITILILMVSTFSYGIATPMQLSGDAGKAILVNLVNNTTLNQTINANQSIDNTADQANTVGQVNNTSAAGLWSWGTLPAGHTIDKSGNLVMVSGDQEWAPSI